jgi:dTDP-glucose 4,6-dehydratase
MGSKKVLLTGVSGFVGHHILEHLLINTDWDIVGMHRSSNVGSLDRVEEVLKDNDEWRARVTIFHHDLRDTLRYDSRLDVDYVLHVGANSHVDRSITHPKEFALDNVIGCVNLLDYYRESKFVKRLEKFIYFSTDEVYGNALGDELHTEEFQHKPRNPYAASKSAAEQFCNAYRVTYDMPIIITNTMNIFGERQDSEKYVSLVMKKILNGEKLSIHGYPDGKNAGSRFYLHARNASAALLFVVENGVIGEKYNIVGNEEIDNLTMAKTIQAMMYEPDNPTDSVKLDYEIVDFHSSRPGHDLRYALDGSKLKKMGYEHPASFEESMKRNVSWTLRNRKRWLGC